MRKTRRAALATLVGASLLAAAIVVAPATAATKGCLPDIGKKLPVLFVHGLNGKPQQWGSVKDPATTIGKIEAMHDVTTDAFDYAGYALRWVTNPNIGHKLAKRIVCMAASSRQQGGRGKVFVVAHSMGGLATRQALAESSEVRNALGMAVTIATPNTGSDFGSQAIGQVQTLCRAIPSALLGCEAVLTALERVFNAIPALATGSKELKALPDWPRGLPVLAIAGNIRPHFELFGVGFNGPPSGTDSLVTTSSALHGNVVNGLGGTKEFVCPGNSPFVVMGLVRANCEHGALVNDSGVQAVVAGAIREYMVRHPLASVSASPSPAPSSTSSGRCMTKAQFRREVLDTAFPIRDFRVTSSVTCQNNWALASGIGLVIGGDETAAAIVYRWDGKMWILVTVGTSFPASDPACQQAPPKIQARLGCNSG